MQRGLFAYRSALLAGLFLFGILSLGLVHSASAAEEAERTVSVTGQGTVMAKPDMAMVNFNVSLLIAGSASEAQKENTAVTNQLIEVLAGLNIAPEDINSNYFSIWPDYDYSAVPEGAPLDKPNGYRVDNQFQVKVHDLDMVNTVIEEATTVENVLMQGVNYSVADYESYLQEAREKAAQSAMQKAAALGQIFKFNVGELLNVSESSYYSDPYYGGGYGGGTNPHQVPITIDVNVTFELQN